MKTIESCFHQVYQIVQDILFFLREKSSPLQVLNSSTRNHSMTYSRRIVFLEKNELLSNRICQHSVQLT